MRPILTGMKGGGGVFAAFRYPAGIGERAHRGTGDHAVWAGRLAYGPREGHSKWLPLRLTRLSLELGRIVVVVAR
jgi:hypothetical protein